MNTYTPVQVKLLIKAETPKEALRVVMDKLEAFLHDWYMESQVPCPPGSLMMWRLESKGQELGAGE